ncbi:MAG: Dabb family protein [Synechococcaceae bacterium WBB_3_034]|nr:Dabb family protein [Synechococcaceae bacterium WBB_3_034]
MGAEACSNSCRLAGMHRCSGRRKGGDRYLIGIETGPQTSGEGADKGLNQGFIVTFKSEGDRNYYVGMPVVHDPAYYDQAHQEYKDFIKSFVSNALVFDFPVEHQTHLHGTSA